MTPFAPSETCTPPSRSCPASGMKTPTHVLSAAMTSGFSTTSPKCGEPISSSPSQTSTRLTGSFLPADLNAMSALRKAFSGPFWLTAPRPMQIVPSPSFGTRRASSGGELHSSGTNCFTSYMKYTPTVVLAPASIRPNTPGLPDVGTSLTSVKPASRASFAMYSGPCG